MNYYEQNMECMKQTRYNLYELLLNNDDFININKLDYIQSDPAANREKYLTVGKGGMMCRLVSNYNPQNEAQKWVEQYEFINMNVIITLFGFGTGSFVREILNSRQEGDLLLIYEPCPELFLHVMQNFDITDILTAKNLVLSIEGLNEFYFHNLLQTNTNITNLTSQINCTHPHYDKLFPESGIKYWKEIKDNHIHAHTNINTEMFFGKRFITNSLFNARFLKDSNRWIDFKETLNLDIPAIIVAAGPSLARNIDTLKKAKGKSYIFVVDRILDYVLDQGLEPDFIVTIDPIKPIEYFTTKENVTIPLLCELVSSRDVLDRHKGRKIVFSCQSFYQKMYHKLEKDAPLIPTGASVATAAFSACGLLGFKKIILVGQDLAYDGELTHAGGVAEKKVKTSQVMVDAIGGGKVLSRSDWYEFLTWFQDMIILIPGIEVIDTKDRGADIKGTIHMSLQQAIDTYCTEETKFDQVLRAMQPTFNEQEMDKVREYFHDSYEELDILKRKAKEAIKICEKQIRIFKINQDDTPDSIRNFEKISKINKYIGELSVYLLLETYITSISAQQISEMYQFTEDAITNKIVTYEKSISIFKAIVQGVDYVKPIFDELIEFI